MQKIAHTPGPWEHIKAEHLSHDAPEIGPLVTAGGIIGGTDDDPCWVIEGQIDFKPDALLIAAAPELLAALQCALFDLEQTYSHVSSVSADRIKNDTIPLCRAAIAKAVG